LLALRPLTGGVGQTGCYDDDEAIGQLQIFGNPVSYRFGICRARSWMIAAMAVLFVAAPTATKAQQAAKIWRIGTLHTSPSSDEADRVAALQRGLAELGYVAGRNVVFVNRNAGTQMDRLPDLATELVHSGVDVIVTSTNPTTLAAMKATTTIPIIMTVGVDPVAAGLVASLARPGANVTGLTFDVDATQLAAKRLEILKELIPSVSRVAVLWNPRYGPGMSRLKGTEEAAHKLGIMIVSAQLSDQSDLERTFTEIRRARADAVTVLSDPVVAALRMEITRLAARYRIPAIYALREFVQDGGLISYATSLLDQWRRAARYVDKILNGRKPSELPVEQPTTFELWINMKTAKALGLTIPPALLLRADKVIE
jgi:putative ABC transport system substrate-binding protein